MSCPPAYAPKELTFGNTTCLPKCPASFYSKKEYDTLYYLQVVTSFFGLIFSIGASVPYLLIERRRRWPQPLHTLIFMIVFILTLQYPVSLMIGGYPSIICSNETKVATRDRFVCILFAMWTYLMALPAVFIWFFICVHLFWSVHRYRLPPPLYQLIFVISVSFGFPSIGFIVAVVNDVIEGNPNSITCYISASKDNGWWIDSLWFIPLGILLPTGFILVMLIFRKVWWEQSIFGFRHYIKTKARILCFTVVAFLPIMVICLYRLYTRVRQSQIKGSIIDWYQCLYATYVDLQNQGYNSTMASSATRSHCDPVLKIPNYTATSIVTYSVVLAATCFPLIFLTQRDVMAWWLGLISKTGLLSESFVSSWSSSIPESGGGRAPSNESESKNESVTRDEDIGE